ncbi:hypothetical protein Tco_1195164 [Tanacetum coccineum]
MLRLCHTLIACSIAGKSQEPEKVTVIDLFYLRGMDVGSVNIPNLLARYLRLFASRRKHGAMISGDLLMIDMAELVRLHICEELDDTWAWVASGPESTRIGTLGTTCSQTNQDYDTEVSPYGVFQFMDNAYWSPIQFIDLARKEIDKVGEVSIIWNPMCVEKGAKNENERRLSTLGSSDVEVSFSGAELSVASR